MAVVLPVLARLVCLFIRIVRDTAFTVKTFT